MRCMALICAVACMYVIYVSFFFFQAEDGIRDLVRSRGLGDVYKRQPLTYVALNGGNGMNFVGPIEVSLTKPDGVVQSQTMNSPHFMGQNVAFPCSTFQNRVEIWATAPEVGRIKVYDQIVPFKSLNP